MFRACATKNLVVAAAQGLPSQTLPDLSQVLKWHKVGLRDFVKPISEASQKRFQCLRLVRVGNDFDDEVRLTRG